MVRFSVGRRVLNPRWKRVLLNGSQFPCTHPRANRHRQAHTHKEAWQNNILVVREKKRKHKAKKNKDKRKERRSTDNHMKINVYPFLLKRQNQTN